MSRAVRAHVTTTTTVTEGDGRRARSVWSFEFIVGTEVGIEVIVAQQLGRDATMHPNDPAAALRVLYVADMELWPRTSGIHHRLYGLATGLAARHDVTLVMLSHHRRTDFPHADRFDAMHVVPYGSCRFGRDARPSPPVARARATLADRRPEVVRGWHSDALGELLRELGTSQHFDAAWITRAYFAEHAFDAGLEPVIVDLPDVDSALLAQHRPQLSSPIHTISHLVEMAALRRWERSVGRRAAALAVCKSDDARSYGSDARTFVVPNTVDVPPEPAGDGERGDQILFVGNLEWGPNIDAVTVFATEVLPRIHSVRPSTQFVIAGKLPRPAVRALADGCGCVVVADPDDLTELYRQAAVVVVPIRRGSGTRLKVVEALAHGKPLVSTATGAEGIGASAGEHYLGAELVEDFADACLTLLGDPGLRRRLGAAGRAWAEQNAGWDRAVDHADALVRCVAARTPPNR